MTKRWHWLFRISLIIGLFCLVPISCFNWESEPTEEDAFNALEPIVRIPLQSLDATGRVPIVFTVSSNRVSRAWGSPFYTILWRTQRNNTWWIHAFSLLQVDVHVVVGSSSVILREEQRVPYGYSSDTQDIGRSFFAKPGDEVEIAISARNAGTLPDGELVVAPDWNLAIKDRLVGAMLNDDLFQIARIFGWIGLALVAIGALEKSGRGRDSHC
jgi:hypothetical protein